MALTYMGPKHSGSVFIPKHIHCHTHKPARGKSLEVRVPERDWETWDTSGKGRQGAGRKDTHVMTWNGPPRTVCPK